MNHLLLFENFYQDTTQDDFSQKVFDVDNCEDFTTEEVAKIKPLLQGGVLDLYVGKKYRIDIRFHNPNFGWNKTPKEPIKKGSSGGKYTKIITIVKLKDEWYYIILSTRDGDVDQSFYKCDQFEGLLSFLKNNVN